MGKTISEKILERASGKKVSPGEFIYIKPDLAITYLGVTLIPPITKEALREVGVERVWDPDKTVVFVDHLVLQKLSEARAGALISVREAIKEQGIKHFYERAIGHQLSAEMGLARPGMLITHNDNHVSILGALGAYAVGVGDDMIQVFATGETWLKVPKSLKFHITGSFLKGVMSRDLWQYILGDIGPDGATDGVMEFTGPTVAAMSIDSRMTLCVFAMFANAQTAIINPDQETVNYVEKRTKEPFGVIKSDPDAEYAEVFSYDVSKLEPQVAIPPDVYYTKAVSEIEGVEIDQALIGTCASGRLEDLRVAAEILRRRTVNPSVRTIVVPSSQEIYLNATREGLIEEFVQADVTVCFPTCDPCMGQLCYLVADETCIATATLNIPSRMGSPEAKIYLANPATVAASAVEGKITDPRKFL